MGPTSKSGKHRLGRAGGAQINELAGGAQISELAGGAQIDKLASLPTRDQAISLLMAVMKAPTEKFVRTLNEVPGKLTRTVAAIRDQKAA